MNTETAKQVVELERTAEQLRRKITQYQEHLFKLKDQIRELREGSKTQFLSPTSLNETHVGTIGN